jgi:ergothioneine biosynthesis protein EgtB
MARPSPLLPFYRSVRKASRELTETLSDADATVQSMPDASPAKWHLAHTTWFFETMVLVPNVKSYVVFDRAFNFLFNSYYETIGARQARPKRGLITRPSLDEIYAYRNYVDAAVDTLLAGKLAKDVADLVELGCHHEQQHQELLLTDILHLFAQNPLKPAYRPSKPEAVRAKGGETTYHAFEGGIAEIGHAGEDFAFDSEGPRHKVFVDRFLLGR